MRGRMLCGAVVAACLLLSGCATLPATAIRDDVATLNGATAVLPADVSYVFQLATDPADLGTARGTTSAVVATVPAGADVGALALPLTDLAVDTAYAYRLCAVPADGSATRCFGTQTFRTWTAHRAEVCPPPNAIFASCVTSGEVWNLTTSGAGVSAGRIATAEPHHGYLEAARTAAGLGTAAAVRTGAKPIEQGLLGDVSGRLEGLAEGTRYLFRACVRRDADGDTVCLDPLSFTTRYTTPVYPRSGGHVRILGGDGGPFGAFIGDANVDARAEPDGSDAGGGASADLSYVLGQPIRYVRGTVSCLAVTGSHAVVGVRSTDDPAQAQWTFFVEDNGGAGRDVVDGVPGRNADDCSPQRFGESTHLAVLDEGRALVEPAVAGVAALPR